MPENGKIYPYFIYDNSGDFICQRKREALEKVKLSGGGTLENRLAGRGSGVYVVKKPADNG